MQKNEKSKKKIIDRLRMVLDDGSGSNVHPDDEKYLKALKKRLGDSSKHVVYTNKDYKKDSESETGSLEPKVTIHLRDEDVVEFPEIAMEEPEKEIEEETSHKDEELYEVEKVKVDSPEFIEVKPKEMTHAEEKDKLKKSEETKEKKLPEWEPVSIEETKTEEPKEETFEEVLPQPVEEKEERSSESEPMPVIEEEKKEAVVEDRAEAAAEFYEEEEEFQLKEEPVLEEKYEEKITEFEEDNKIEVFSGITSINKNMAILLYDNGFTSINDVMDATLKDLMKIKGMKRKVAKKMKKEIEEKFKNVSLGHNDSKKTDEFGESPVPVYGEASTSEPVKEDELFFEDEKEDYIDGFTKKDEETKAFEGINSIDEKTAKLLYENGITSTDILNETPVKKLIKIKGIRRKIAKRMKKEVSEMPKKTDDIEDWTAADDDFAIDEFKGSDESEEAWESFSDGEMTEKQEGYKHEDYTLYEREVETESGKKRIVRFFSKAKPDEGDPIELPKGYEVKKNKKTGVPYLRKKK